MICNKEEYGVSVPDSKVFVYDCELDKLAFFDFGPTYYPVSQHWDAVETKLIAVETRRYESQRRSKKKKSEEENGESLDESKSELDELVDKVVEAEVTTLFATQDHGILMQDSFPINKNDDALMSLCVPDVALMHRTHDDSGVPTIIKTTLRDFQGITDLDEKTKQDLLHFSYYLTIGNMDEAHKAVKKIKSKTVWENMAKTCVKNKRLDVAEVCFGNMRNAAGARAVREAKIKYPELEARVAVVALQLGMVEEAEELYKSCDRWDLLVNLYTSVGRWEEALAVCSKYDRIHLKTVHYMYAKFLEANNETSDAAIQFEKSETHAYEVPRMLHHRGQMKSLHIYIDGRKEEALFKWWAVYLESKQDFEGALEYYKKANDVVNEVRVLGAVGRGDDAMGVCLERESLPAYYSLARHYEQNGEIKSAIQVQIGARRIPCPHTCVCLCVILMCG
jgi:intraflagellar transport protein 140